jgi:hypothetical protein
MTVKELLEMYEDGSDEVKIYGDNFRLIARDAIGLVAASTDIANRTVVKFAFSENTLCIQVKETVYDMVMKMNKTDFANFCLSVYRMGLKDGSDAVTDECWVACHLTDCTAKQYYDWINSRSNIKSDEEENDYD